MKTNRGKILDEATELVYGDRQNDYGSPRDNFGRIAQGWSVILGQDITLPQVALCMAWLKIARLVQTPNHKDSFVDGAAYMALAGELASDE